MQALSASEQKVDCLGERLDGWIAPRLFDYRSKRGANNQECFHKVNKQTEGHTQSASSSLWDIFNKLTNNEYC